MKKLTTLSFLIFCFLFNVLAQGFDTLKVMQYNLLNYRNINNFCDDNSNSPANKEANLAKIIGYSLPDVLAVNEMGADFRNSFYLLENALNTNGRTFYEDANFSNRTGSNLVNMLFYNTNKIALMNQEQIYRGTDGRNLIRQADVYHLYDKRTAARKDTAYFSIIVVHLKAGSTNADQNERSRQTAAIMNYIKDGPSDRSYLIAGDFNVQSSSESAYENLVSAETENVRFYDPKEAPGNWNNNATYANLHTQSTRSTATNGGCFSGGGMDDRYDFILMNKALQNSSSKIFYLNNSYEALGQDAQHFNLAVNQGKNFKVPEEIANALYEVSDHLPVQLSLLVKKDLSSTALLNPHSFAIPNPIRNELVIQLKAENLQQSFHLQICDMLGRIWIDQHITFSEPTKRVLLPANIPQGYLVVSLNHEQAHSFRKLVFKQN